MRKVEMAAVLVIVQVGESPFLWGPPGQGKSSFIRHGFGKLGYIVHVLRVNTILPHHMGGSPIPTANGQSIRHAPPEWAIKLNEAEKSILFLDDVSCASTMGQTAALQILDEKRVGDMQLKAIPVAAANPNTLATARFELDGAAANRCVHVPITSDAATFRASALAGFPAPDVPKLRPNWEQLIPTKMRLILDYLDSPEGASQLNDMPERITEKTVAFPTERTWEKCWRLLAACDCIDPVSIPGCSIRELRTQLFTGCVGEGAWKKFLSYYTKPMLIRTDEALRHGKAFSYPEEGDQMFGLLEALSQKLLGSNLTEEMWNRAWSFAEGAWETSHRDLVVTFVLDLLSLKLGYDFKLPRFYTKTLRKALESTI